jgi:hypothetical protein
MAIDFSKTKLNISPGTTALHSLRGWRTRQWVVGDFAI